MVEMNQRFFPAKWETQETNLLAELIQRPPGGEPPSLPTSQVKAKLPKLVLP